MPKNVIVAVGLISIITVSLFVSYPIFGQSYSIPLWIKNNAKWWSEGQIEDSDFLKGLQYLIEKKIIIIPETKQGSASTKAIPDWVKNNARWWSQDQIGDLDFVSGVQYLIQNGIIVVQPPDSVVKQKEVTIVEDKQTIMKANTIFAQGEVSGCGRGYADEPSYQDISYYDVVNGNIVLSENLSVSSDIKKWQDDVEKHREIWSLFSKIIPPQYLDDVGGFTIFTDGLEWQTIDVWPNRATGKWDFVVDIADWYCRGSLNEISLKRYIPHELGHMITLDSSQIAIDYDLSDIWFFGDGEYAKIFKEKNQNCKEPFMTHSGCSKENSYINRFVNEFQIEKFTEHINFRYPFYSNQWGDALESHYNSHRSDYVTDYAASDPHEDIAESWTAFVLKEKPEPNTTANKKILFFYNFPELVEIRSFIRNNLN